MDPGAVHSYVEVSKDMTTAGTENVQPLDDQVLVRPLDQSTTDSQEGQVIAVGPHEPGDLDVQPDDMIRYAKDLGTPINYGKDTFVMISLRDVLEIIDK
ncbi:hypothetical protein [Nocardia brasiliensis]|uniref:hypothetical protein n=1 Tax=Nocardia brasiliensis TaxID=37326 RepID=UPI00366DB269